MAKQIELNSGNTGTINVTFQLLGQIIVPRLIGKINVPVRRIYTRAPQYAIPFHSPPPRGPSTIHMHANRKNMP